MIVYPQINNLRLIVIPFMLLLFALGFYSFKSYESLKDYQEYIVNENALIEKELGDMILSYHDLEIENDSILSKLQLTKSKIFRVLDSIQSSEPNVSLITRYKQQLIALKAENKNILGLIAALDKENDFLKTEVNYVGQELEQSQQYVSQYKKKTKDLARLNSGMEKKLDEAAKVVPSKISVQAVKRLKSNKMIVNTTSSRRTKKLNVCFTIPSNKLTQKGNQTYYLQVIDPNNNVVGDQGTIDYSNGKKLIISKTVSVNYSNKAIDLCEFISYNNENERFQKGTYYVSLYNAEGFILNTSMTLK